jgi:hypothetical protein
LKWLFYVTLIVSPVVILQTMAYYKKMQPDSQDMGLTAFTATKKTTIMLILSYKIGQIIIEDFVR